MKHLNSMTKEQLDEFDAVINHPANEWLIFFWVMGKVFYCSWTPSDATKKRRSLCAWLVSGAIIPG